MGGSAADNVFQTVVVADVDLNAPSHVLCAATMEHVMKLGKGYVQVPHSARLVGDINNPAFLPLIYPMLFSYSLGAPEEDYNRHHHILEATCEALLENVWSLISDSLFIYFHCIQCASKEKYSAPLQFEN